MTAALARTLNLAMAIQSLLDLKSDRDNVSFTPYKLAKAIKVDRSLIQRIINGDVENPRIDTLMKIIQFFSNDGFKVTLDDVLKWEANIENVQGQALCEGSPQTLPLYQMENFNGEPIASTTMILPKTSPGTVAVLSSKNIKPIFTPGSVFVVDMLKQPEHENLVMIRLNSDKQILLKKWIIKNNEIFLYDHTDDSSCSLHEFKNLKTIGVVTRVNIKT